VSFATAQLPGGYLSDRIGERATVVASMVLTVVALGMIVLAPGLVPFVAGVVLLGFTTGLYATPRITVLTDVYRPAQVRARSGWWSPPGPHRGTNATTGSPTAGP
jgi:MFS family permease